jgi:hypothetical protein
MERKLTAILCADVFGYSRLMGRMRRRLPHFFLGCKIVGSNNTRRRGRYRLQIDGLINNTTADPNKKRRVLGTGNRGDGSERRRSPASFVRARITKIISCGPVGTVTGTTG